jgi:general secretion pathway protein F
MQGLTPVQLLSSVGQPGDFAGSGPKVRMSLADQALFCRVVGTLLESGLDVSSALESVAKQAHARNKLFYQELNTGVARGQDLSAVLNTLLGDKSIVPMAAIAAGERTGQVAGVLLTSADYADEQAALRARVQAALLYPIILTLVSMLVAIGLVTYVVPEVARVFDGLERELPWVTRTLLGFAAFVETQGVWLIVGTVLVGISMAMFSRSESGQRLIHQVTLGIPLVSGLLLLRERERFFATLALLTSGAVPMVEAVEGSARAMRNSVLRDEALAVASGLERGRRLDEELARTRLVAPITLQLVSAGIDSARLGSMAARAASLDRNLLQRRLTLMLGLLEPALILLMGGFVLLIVIAILLPVFELNSLVL